MIVAVLWAAAVAGFVVFVLPQINGLGPTIARLRAGDARWLAVGAAFEAASLGAYVVLFHASPDVGSRLRATRQRTSATTRRGGSFPSVTSRAPAAPGH